MTDDQARRRSQAEAGLCVVANIRSTKGVKRVDEALIAWAEAKGRYVRIDRRTEWGNPFQIPADGNRDEVVSKFRELYLPTQPQLLERLPTLRGKVLGCWCHPLPCHGHVIAEAVNGRVDVLAQGEPA